MSKIWLFLFSLFYSVNLVFQLSPRRFKVFFIILFQEKSLVGIINSPYTFFIIVDWFY